jgi:hypothetical protein
LKIRSSIVAAVAVISSLGLLAPAAHAGGSVCYSATVTVNGETTSQAGCQELP